MINKPTIEKTVHNVRCNITWSQKKVEITARCGGFVKFVGKTEQEAEMQLLNWINRRPRMRDEAAITEEYVKSLLGTLDMPKSHIRISSGHYKQNPVYRESFTVRRSIGADGKIYFGTYHNEHAAKTASIRLCELINEEIDRRIIVRESTAPEELPLKRRGGRYSVRHQRSVVEKQMFPMTLEYE